jgi:short-subunit dehydrogenase
MDRNLERMTITVAGATGVIGGNLCKHLVERGANVYGLGRDPEKLKALDESLAGGPGTFFPVALNSLGPDGWETAINAILKHADHVDVFVHAIGTIVPGGVMELTDLEIQKILQTNFVSAVHASRTVLPDMIARGKGHFIVVGSLGGIVPMPYETLYCASKFALRGFCLSLQEELRPTGVSVSLLSPGAVDGAMLRAEGSDWRAALTFAQTPLNPDRVSSEAICLMHTPGGELLVPRRNRTLAALLNLFPKFFALTYPFFLTSGKRRLRRYRESDDPTESKHATECYGSSL